jgi:type IV secretory pathway VirB4 component
MAIDMRLTDAELREALRDCAYSLRQLSEGALAGMFDGPTSEGVNLDGRLVVLDLSAIDDEQALSILMICATAWINNRIHAERRSGDTTKRLLVVDEAWHILADPFCAEWLQRGFKLSRSLGVAHCIVMHRLSDVRAAGDEGSRTQALAQGLVSDAQTKIIYRQMAGELPLLQSTFGLTDAELSWLPHLPVGRALWKIGGRSVLVQMTPATPAEWAITDTDQRMNEAQVQSAVAS